MVFLCFMLLVVRSSQIAATPDKRFCVV
jgi:hypothetical protein